MLSNRLLNCAKYLPKEFARKTRSLTELDRWKATEYRTFLIYLGPIVLKNILSTDLYEHFLLFHVAIRILLHSNVVKNNELLFLSKDLLKTFVKNCSVLYGKESCIFNVHALLHLPDDVPYFSLSLNEISAFAFELYIGSLKNKLRRFHKPLAQISKRLSEATDVKVVPRNRNNVNNLLVNNKDNFVKLTNNKILKITSIEPNGKLTGFVSTNLKKI